jgi:hypothetical protein
MSEKASRNEGADESADLTKDLPGIPAGEELALGPVEGEEIDPLPKWWDEPLASEKTKSGNRRIEDGIEFEAPRRKKPLPRLDQDDLSLPVVVSEEKEPLPDLVELPEPAKKSGIEEVPDFAEVVMSGKKADLLETDGDLMSGAWFEAKPLKRQRRECLENSPGSLADFFDGDAADELATPEGPPAVEPVEPEPAKKDNDFDLLDLPKKGEPKSERSSQIEAVPAEAPRKPGPPPIPVPTAVEALDVATPSEQTSPEEVVDVASDEVPTLGDPAAEPESWKIAEGDGAEPLTEIAPGTEPPFSVVSDSALETDEREPEPEQDEEDPAKPEPVEEEKPADLADPAGIATAPATPLIPLAITDSIGSPLPVAEGAPAAAEPSVDATTKKKAGCWTIFTALFFFVAMLVLTVVCGAAAYAWSKFGDFEKELTTLAVTRLEEQGIHFDYGTWRYEFPRGVVLEEVTFYDDATKARPAIKATGLGVNLDFLSLARQSGGMAAAEFSLRDSKVTLFQKGELFAEINGVDGEIFADASAITVERLAARVGGLRVDLDGIVRLPDKTTQPPVAVTDAPAPGAKASVLASLDFSGFRALEPWLGLEGNGSQPPLLSFSFEMDAKEPDLATIEGNLGGSDLRWRGIDLKSLSASFRIDPKTGELRFPNVQIGYGEGLVTAVFAIDLAAQKLRIESLQSTVDPIALLVAFDPSWVDQFKSVRLVDAPTMQITGEIPLGDPANADLKIRYEHRQGLVYLDGDRELPVSEIRGLFAYDRGALETNDAAGNVFGGQLYLNGATNLIREKRPFTGLIEIIGMDLKKAGGWFDEKIAGLDGRLNLTFRGTGNAEVASINGGGDVRIEEATLTSFPAIGPIQEMIGKVVPAFAFKGNGRLTGAYILESGVLVTSDLTLRNAGARIVTNGSVNLASKATTFVATADLETSLAAATGLKDKSIQIEGSGSIDGPVLKIRRFPVEFAAAGLGEVLGTSPQSLGGLKELVGSENAAEVISGKIEETTGLQLDPAVTDLLKGLLGGETAPAAPAAAPTPIRAVPQE